MSPNEEPKKPTELEVISPKSGDAAPQGKPALVQPQPDPEAYAFKADMRSRPGWMLLELNLDALSRTRDNMWKFLGFMEDHKAIGLQIMVSAAQQRELIRNEVNKQSNKNGFRKFISNLTH